MDTYDHFDELYEKQLDEQNEFDEETRMKTKLIHHMRNPITSVGGVARILKRKLKDDKELIKYLNVLTQESARAESFLAKTFTEIQESPKRAKIFRSIEFDPEHKQAGISILSYFGQIISQKYPDTASTVRIEQRGQTVTLIIETEAGEIERIEKSLEVYGKIVCGQAEPKDLLSNERDILEFKHKLEISAMELRLTKELYNQHKESQNKRIENLESEINELRFFLGNSINSLSKIRDEFVVFIKQNENNREIANALKTLSQSLMKESQPNNTSDIDEALLTIKDENPELFGRMNELLIGTLASAGGGTISHWIISVLNSLPK